MKTALAVLAAVLLAAVGWSQPLQAQGVPQGSYLSSCTNVDVRANTLTATCRRAGGGPLRNALAGVHQCTGDIGNNNGVLQCNFPGGAVARGQVVQGPGGPGGGPPPYAQRPPGPSHWEHCQRLQQRAEDLRARRDWAWYPDERARFEWRLREVRDEMRQEGCRR